MDSQGIRCRGTLKLHIRPSETDRWLEELGLYRKRIARDSSCLFRAISENIYNSQQNYLKVRQDCVNFMSINRSMFEGYIQKPYELYLKDMLKPTQWGTLTEVLAMTHLYRRELIIFEANKESKCLYKGYGNPIFLFYSEESKHFDVIYSKEYINKSSLCQSLIYETLYEGVFQMKDLSYAVDKMLYDKLPSQQVQYLLAQNVDKDSEKTIEEEKDSNNNMLSLRCKHQSGHLGKYKFSQEILSIVVFNRKYIHLENICLLCLNLDSAKDLLDNGIIPFPYKVAKALDPSIYRNIEFDVWIEKRKEQRYGARFCDGTTLQVGAKCLCKLSHNQEIPYHCHIQHMDPNGPCIVFIEELGEKQVVDFEQLESLPRDQLQPWTPPYRYSRIQSQFLTISQVLQQLGNINSKGYHKNCKGKPEKPSEQQYMKPSQPMVWDEENNNMIDDEENFIHAPPPEYYTDTYNFTTYHFIPISPVEVTALPLMVDCRGPSGGSAEEKHETGAQPAAAASGHAPQADHHHSQGATNDLCAVTPTAAIPPVPAVTGQMTHHSYTGPGMGGYGYGMYPPPYVYGMGGAGLVKGGVVWCGGAPPVPHAPPGPPAPHVPPGVNPHVYKSVQPNGTDLPMNDIATLRYYFNLGVEYAYAGYLPPAPAPRPYTHHDLTQDMSHMGVADRAAHEHANKMADKHAPHALHKPAHQRPVVGPRFKRNNYEGNHNMNQNKGYNNNNNNMNNKGPNNRRNSQPDSRPVSQGPFAEYEPAPVMPYSHIYQPYYPVEADPGMMGMVGGMPYIGYEEGGAEFVPYYPHYPPPPTMPVPPPPTANDHKN